MHKDQEERLEPMASEVIGTLEQVARTSRDSLANSRPFSIDLLANGGNTLNSDLAMRRLGVVHEDNEAAYRTMVSEPAVVRAVAEDEDGKRHTYYFCRAKQGIPALGRRQLRRSDRAVGGATCRRRIHDGGLPKMLEPLHKHFGTGWDVHAVLLANT